MPVFDNNSRPLFEFDFDGNIKMGSLASMIDGVNEFADYYVAEWLLWYRSGAVDLRTCDKAAFMVSILKCQFSPDYFHDNKIDWIKDAFLLINADSIPVRVADISLTTLTALNELRPSICSEELSPNTTYDEELLQLALPIEKMLILGGDHRLSVDQDSQLNGYGCRPFPRPEAITFSSSTATSISKYAYDHVEKRRQQLIHEAIQQGVQASVSNLAEEVRQGICRNLGIEHNVAEIVLTASGTDSFLIAQGLIRLIDDAPHITLMVGVDESGSGVKLALQERHFADDTALAAIVKKGQLLSGSENHQCQIAIAVRDKTGKAVPLRVLDNQVKELVATHIEAGNHVIVHAMNHSKLGYSGPSRALLLELKHHMGNKCCIVVDACQMRLDREEILEYLEHQIIVIITGSKYFTGPPFCGSILIPDQIACAIQAKGEKFDKGFNDYCAKEDFPRKLQAVLGKEGKNFNLGSLFRWIAALAEMERYYKIPSILRAKAVSRFCERVEEILLATPFLELNYQDLCCGNSSSVTCGELSGRRMIFPFFLFYEHQGVRTVCTEEQVQKIYTLLNQDCSKLFPYKNAREFRLLAQMCHIGQPVPVFYSSGISSAVLRISVGARIFSESFSKSKGRIIDALIEDEYWQIGVVLGKIELLLNGCSN